MVRSGASVIEAAPSRRSNVRWDVEELDRVAGIVFKLRLKHPEESMWALVRRAQEQLPADRRRQIDNVQSGKPIIDRVKALGERQAAEALEAETLRQSIGSRPSLEQALENLDDEEVMRRYKDR